MKKDKPINAETIASHLIVNAEKLRFGTASVSLKVHEGTITAVSHETIEIVREKEILNELTV